MADITIMAVLASAAVGLGILGITLRAVGQQYQADLIGLAVSLSLIAYLVPLLLRVVQSVNVFLSM